MSESDRPDTCRTCGDRIYDKRERAAGLCDPCHIFAVTAQRDDLLCLFVENWRANGYRVRLPAREGGYPGQCDVIPYDGPGYGFHEFDNEDQVRAAATLAASEGLFSRRLEVYKAEDRSEG